MATNVIMPALGMDQDFGTLVRWIKQSGEVVAKGEPIMEVETDKVVVEIDAIASGVLSNVIAVEGDSIPVGQVMAQILDETDARVEYAASAGRGAPTIAAPTLDDEDELAEADANLPPLPARPDAAPHSSGSPTLAGAAALTPASPKARRIAAEFAIDVAALTGSGPASAVLAADILAATISGASPARLSAERSASVPANQAAPPVDSPEVPVSGAWRVMAERMVTSWTSAPHFFLMREVEATGLVDMRTRLLPAIERRSGVRLTYTDLLVKLLAAALLQHPRVNASVIDGAIRENPEINVGIAVAAGDGLVVHVIRGADTRSVGEIAARREALVERAESGRLTLDDLTGGTFTLTNLGMYRVDAFNAIINPPQAAILAVGRIADRVVALDGQPAVRPTIILSLSCDHRVVDGARGARFLDDVANLIEEPWGILV